MIHSSKINIGCNEANDEDGGHTDESDLFAGVFGLTDA